MLNDSSLVSRISAESKVNKLKIELDINTDIYPMNKDQNTGQYSFYKLVLANSVNSDGSDGFDIVRYENAGSAGSGMGQLIDNHEYVMHGKVFKYQLDEAEKKM